MKNRRKLETAIDSTWKVTILSVSPCDEDQSSLEAIIGHSRWMLFKARDLVSAGEVDRRDGTCQCHAECSVIDCHVQTR